MSKTFKQIVLFKNDYHTNMEHPINRLTKEWALLTHQM